MKSLLRAIQAGCLLLPCVALTLPSGEDTPIALDELKSFTPDEIKSVKQKEPKKWRQEKPPKMIVFGDSNSDAGRRFNAPASFDFEGIGPWPWRRLYDGPDSHEKTAAYMPKEGTATNGKVWPTWLRIPDEHNFATSSGGATDTFKSRESCLGYTGEFEEMPTGILDEQIDRYLAEVVQYSNETLDYTHVIFIGTNDINRAIAAQIRYATGGIGYQDPVPFNKIFQVDEDTGAPILGNGLPVPDFGTVISEIIEAWSAGIVRLMQAGVTGKILLANIGSPKGLSAVVAAPEQLASLDAVTQFIRSATLGFNQISDQIKVLDMYTLFAKLVDEPSVFTDLGFTTGEGGLLADPCVTFNFRVDDQAEIMNTQTLRNENCQGTCALCADSTSPCQNCLEENPSITKCDEPDSKIFYDGIHFTTRFHLVFGEAIRQCSKDSPNYSRPLVSIMCPPTPAGTPPPV